MRAYRFSCPDCDVSFVVDAGVRERLLAAGCAVCGAGVGPTAFTANTFGTNA